MELTWCRSFIAVYELGGFSVAARALHRSQSRVSAHVAALEAHVGEPLLHRDVHPPTLTSAGEAFLVHARGVTDEWSAAVAAVAARRGEVRGTVSLGSVPSVSSGILAPLCADFGRRHPEVTFEVHEGPNSWLAEALAKRTIELSIQPTSPYQPAPTILTRNLLDDPFLVVLRRDHELSRSTAVDLHDLAGEPVITTGEAGLDARIGGEYREVLADVDVDLHRSMAVTQPTTVFAFVKAGVGVGLMGDLAVRMMRDPELTSRPVQQPLAVRQIGVRWASTRRLSPAAQTFLGALQDFVQERHLPGGRLSSPVDGVASAGQGPGLIPSSS